MKAKYAGYMTASAVKRDLGLSDTELKTSREAGLIGTWVPPGKKYRLYLASDVHALRAAREAELAATGVGPARVRSAIAEDVPELARLIREVFGTQDLNRDLWAERFQLHPEVGYVVEVNGEVLACAFVLPLPRDFIERILLTAEVTPPIYSDLIQPFEAAAGPLHLFFYTWGVSARVPLRKKRAYGMLLVRTIAHKLVEWGERGIAIANLWSRSKTPEGIRLLRGIGFTQIQSRTEYRNFVIEVVTSGLEVIEDYRRAFEENTR